MSIVAGMIAGAMFVGGGDLRNSQHWKVLNRNSGRVVSIDMKSIERSGSIATYLLRTQLQRPPKSGVAAIITKSQVDCTNGERARLSAVSYRSDGTVVAEQTFTREWKSVPSGLMQKIHQIVCDH